MKARKIPALLIALCMLVALVPAMPAASAAEGDTTTISFLVSGETAVTLNTVKIANGSGWELNTSSTYTHASTVSYSNITDYSWSRSYETAIWLGTNDVNSAKAGINFVVEKAGWYDLTLNILATRGGAATTAVAVNGKELNSVTWPGVTASQPSQAETVAKPLGNVFLTEGVNVIAFTKIGGGNERVTGSSIYLHSLELKESTNTISFISKTGATHTLKEFTLANDGWTIDQTYTNTDAYSYSIGTNAGAGLSDATTTCANIWLGGTGETNGVVAIGFNAPEAGWYDINLNTVDKASCDLVVSATINGENVGSITWPGTAKNSVIANALGTVYLKKGTNLLQLRRTCAYTDRIKNNTLYLHSLTFSASDSAPTNFGNTYAYVQEINDGRDTKYKLSIIGGIDGLEYDCVGFEIIVDGRAMGKTEIDKVYKSLKLENTAGKSATLTAENFFDAAEDCYIFCDSREYDANLAGKKIEFRAYAANGDETVYGAWATVETLAK